MEGNQSTDSRAEGEGSGKVPEVAAGEQAALQGVYESLARC